MASRTAYAVRISTQTRVPTGIVERHRRTRAGTALRASEMRHRTLFVLAACALLARCSAQLYVSHARVAGSGVASIELRTAAGDDVARNGTATASTNANLAARVIDGRQSTHWEAAEGNWVAVTLREPAILQSIAVFPRQYSPASAVSLELLDANNNSLLQSRVVSAVESGGYWVWRMEVPLSPSARPSPSLSATASRSALPAPAPLSSAWQPGNSSNLELWLRLDELHVNGIALLRAGGWPLAIPAGAVFATGPTAPVTSAIQSLNGFAPVSFSTAASMTYSGVNYAGVRAYTLAYLARVTGTSQRVLTSITNNYFMGWHQGAFECAFRRRLDLP